MKYINGIREIKPLRIGSLSSSDLIGALLVDLGCSVSGIPRTYISKSYHTRWEIFDPEKVKDPKDLTTPWSMVWRVHHESDRIDCVRLAYRYVHTPIDIIPQYPHVPCKGIFCICHKEVKLKDLTVSDLIHIGNDFE